MRFRPKIDSQSIKLSIRGGLGNQLFQLSGALFTAKRLSANLVVDETALINHSDSSRQNWIKKLDLEELIGGTEVIWVSDPRLKFPNRKDGYQEIDEDALIELVQLKSNLSFRGWFQNSFYPKSIALTKKSLKPISISINLEEHIRAISNSNRLAGIHMRFGDFKDTSWGSLSSDWYANAFEELNKKEIVHAHVYTDDFRTAKKMLEEIPRTFSISFPEEESPLRPDELLWVLRQYENFLSSNSTLSWWASFLNIHENPTIYCPWEENLYLNPWIKIL